MLVPVGAQVRVTDAPDRKERRLTRDHRRTMGPRWWLGCVVPGAFAGPWTPLPHHFPARIPIIVARTVRAGKRRGRVARGGRFLNNPTRSVQC
jgi:hypothetical protein